MKLYLTAMDKKAQRAGLPERPYDLAINQMSITLAASYRRDGATTFPGLSPTYESLVESMLDSVAPGNPEGYVLKEIRTLEAGPMRV